MTNSTPVELEASQNILKPTVAILSSTDCGKICLYSSIDVLLMILSDYKNGRPRDFLASLFEIKSCTFLRIITIFVETATDGLYDKLVMQKVDFFL